MKLRIVLIILAAAGFCSCADVTTESTYTVRLWWDVRSNQRVSMLEADVAAAYLDTTQWYVASYADIVAAGGPFATSKADGVTKTPMDMESQRSFPGRNEFSIHFTGKPAMLLAWHTNNPMFAWCDANIIENLPERTLTLVFKPLLLANDPTKERRDTTYIDGLWRVTNEEGITVPVDCEYSITVKQRFSDGATGVNVPTMTAHAFLADTARWYVASYEDALAGTVTNRRTGERLDAYMSGEFNEDGDKLLFTLHDLDVMFVLCDTEQPMYGYGDANIRSTNPLQKSAEMTFPVYLPNSRNSANAGAWVVITGDTVVPPEPEDPEDPEDPVEP